MWEKERKTRVNWKTHWAGKFDNHMIWWDFFSTNPWLVGVSGVRRPLQKVEAFCYILWYKKSIIITF